MCVHVLVLTCVHVKSVRACVCIYAPHKCPHTALRGGSWMCVPMPCAWCVLTRLLTGSACCCVSLTMCRGGGGGRDALPARGPERGGARLHACAHPWELWGLAGPGAVPGRQGQGPKNDLGRASLRSRLLPPCRPGPGRRRLSRGEPRSALGGLQTIAPLSNGLPCWPSVPAPGAPPSWRRVRAPGLRVRGQDSGGRSDPRSPPAPGAGPLQVPGARGGAEL